MPSTRSILGPTGLLLLLFGALTLIFIDAASVWLGNRTGTYAQAMEQAQRLRTVSGRLLTLLDDAETGQRGYLLTGDPQYLLPYQQASENSPHVLADLRDSLTDALQKSATNHLSQVVEDKFAELRQTIQLYDSGQRDRARQIVETDRGKLLMDQARELIGDLIRTSDANVAARGQDMRSGSNALQASTIVGSIVVVLLVAGTVRTFLGFAKRLEQSAKEIETLNRGLEERVAERTADLFQANEEIQRFAYIISHDLRAPLVNVMGFTSELEVGFGAVQKLVARVGESRPDLLSDEARLAANEDVPEALGFIRSSTAKMDRLINAILKLSREGRRLLTPERVDMTVLMDSIAASVRHQIIEAGAEFELAGHLPPVISDRLVLEQIFGNLVDNAVKYLDPDRPGRIEVRGREEAGRLVYEVRDNGRGIADRDHERIFELFRRSGAQDRPGEGIGLAHVRALTRRLGGVITVESELGKGTVFRVNLPKVLPAGAESMAS